MKKRRAQKTFACNNNNNNNACIPELRAAPPAPGFYLPSLVGDRRPRPRARRFCISRELLATASVPWDFLSHERRNPPDLAKRARAIGGRDLGRPPADSVSRASSWRRRRCR